LPASESELSLSTRPSVTEFEHAAAIIDVGWHFTK
jgi:hypothetical protein